MISEDTVARDGPKLRPYQKELVEPAMQGHNGIIVSPSNTGKTFVAMHLAKVSHHVLIDTD